MRGLDTNILVRLLTLDDPQQIAVVQALFAEGTERNERYHVTCIVLCELVWVLRTTHHLKRDKICPMLEALFSVRQFEIQDRDLAKKAVEEYGAGQGDFADYLIGQQNRRAGCDDTISFDGKLAGHPGFMILR